MSDKEEVLLGLGCLAQQAQDARPGTCAGCSYFRPFTDDPEFGWCDRTEIAKDALNMVREQRKEIKQLRAARIIQIHHNMSKR